MIEIMISSSVLIIAICLLRVLLKGRINPRIQYAMWLLVVLRLIAGLFSPVYKWLSGWRSRFSVMNVADRFHERVIEGTSVEFLVDNLATGHVYSFDEPVNVVMKAAGIDWQLWIMVIWAVGTLVLVIWMWNVNLKLHNHFMKNREPYHGNLPEFVTKRVYTISELKSPCYFGFLGEDAIYLPEQVTEDPDILKHSLAHEMGHVKQGDLVFGGLRLLFLCIFWVNPLIWLAATLSKRDAELSCDEIAVGLLGEEERISYGKTLLCLVSQKKDVQDLFSTATTMAEEKKVMKERIEMLVKHPKRTLFMMIGIGCVSLVLVACTFSSGIKTEKREPLLSMTTQQAGDEAKENKGNEDFAMKDNADDKNEIVSEILEPQVEILGQWANYYQMVLSGVEWDETKHAISILVYEDEEATVMIGDGTPEQGYGYYEYEDGTVCFDFWNTEHAKSLRVQVTYLDAAAYAGVAGTKVEKIVYAETTVALGENQSARSEYTFKQTFEGIDGSFPSVISVYEYPNALVVKIGCEQGKQEELSKQIFFLKMAGAETKEDWIPPRSGFTKDSVWTGLYLLSEYDYPTASLEAIVCGGRTGYMNTQTEYVVNELEMPKIRETVEQFLREKYGEEPEDTNLAIFYNAELKETYAEALYRVSEDDSKEAYLHLKLNRAFGEWSVTSEWLKK